MSVALYMDVQVRWAITAGLRRRGVDVLTPQQDGAARFEDPALLDRATQLGRVLVSQDDDLQACGVLLVLVVRQDAFDARLDLDFRGRPPWQL